ncbi:hypothetical protein LC20_01578 [Yersinia hibernica]|uniref:Invasin n=1 Tax=Yersinia enterocolitica LC20 TaxID=1443113 RepID=A0A7U4K0P1_YEREN|nr:hypothetical protein LC20_01578 [Yersinia hibernica]
MTNGTVTVPNAGVKTGSSWSDNNDGTYTRLYTAQTAGSDLKAQLKLTDWNEGKESNTYIITAGTAAQATSAINTDSTTYAAGSDMEVTVTLRDVLNNPVNGQAAALTNGTVTVPNAGVKTGSSWSDNNDGTYTRLYTAQTAGSDLKAQLKLTDWNEGKESNTYIITAGTAAQATSAINTDSTTYAAGSDMEVTVTLKDVLNNPVNGQAAALTNGTVTVPNAGVKTGSSWSDNNDGTYTRLYTAQTAGSDLKAQLKLTGWVTQSESVAYRIWGVAVLKDIFVNNSTFAKDAGFPTTGFTGAKFTLNLMSDSGGTATDYSWNADAPWVSVSDGVVSFTGTGNGNKVTITGTPKSGIGATINYSYTVKGWYINSGATRTLRSEADAYCATKSDYKLPTVRQLSSDNWNGNTGSIQTGSIGGLYGEWGSLTSYSGAGFDEANSWASEWFDSDYSIAVNTTYGSVNVFSKDNVTPYPIVCRKPL